MTGNVTTSVSQDLQTISHVGVLEIEAFLNIPLVEIAEDRVYIVEVTVMLTPATSVPATHQVFRQRHRVFLDQGSILNYDFGTQFAQGLGVFNGSIGVGAMGSSFGVTLNGDFDNVFHYKIIATVVESAVL